MQTWITATDAAAIIGCKRLRVLEYVKESQ